MTDPSPPSGRPGDPPKVGLLSFEAVAEAVADALLDEALSPSALSLCDSE
jgi:hypothetical protein